MIETIYFLLSANKTKKYRISKIENPECYKVSDAILTFNPQL